MLASLITATALGTVLAGVGGYGFAEARRIQVERRTITSPKIPEAFDGARVVFVTDVHAGPYFGDAQMRSLVQRVNELEPDVLLLGGDNVGGGRGSGASVFYPAARDFKARLGKYAVLGNHDVWEGEAEARKGLAEAGFDVLDNESVAVQSGGQQIFVGGIDDLYTGSPDAKAAAHDVRGGFSVLMAHNPDAFDAELPRTPDTWDLALSGHTHGGQLTFFGRYAPILPSRFGNRYRTGWRKESGVPILVSNGVGTVTAPVRLFARPEIHVFELKREPNTSVLPAPVSQPAFR